AAFRADHGDHHADQLIAQLPFAAVADQARRDRGVHVAAGGLAIDTGPLGDRAQPEPVTAPLPQNLSYLVHTNLPNRPPPPPDQTTWTDSRQPASTTPAGAPVVVPRLAIPVVPCPWQNSAQNCH